MIEKTRQELRDTMAANGLILQEDGDGVCRLKSFAKKKKTYKKIYSCDNGALYCEEHLGMTARATGRDISGKKIRRVRLSDVREFEAMGLTLACETCGCEASVAGR